MIDVRTEWEFKEGHIHNAKGPLLVEYETNWESSVLSWGANKEKTQVILYCTVGSRSQLAKEVMESQGWKNVINAGGYETHKA
jgi:phage shock protein E